MANIKIWLLLQGDNTDVFDEGNCKLIGVFTKKKKALAAGRFVIAIHADTNFAPRDYDYNIDVAKWIDEQVYELDDTCRTTEGSIAFMLKESYTDVIDVDALDV